MIKANIVEVMVQLTWLPLVEMEVGEEDSSVEGTVLVVEEVLEDLEDLECLEEEHRGEEVQCLAVVMDFNPEEHLLQGGHLLAHMVRFTRVRTVHGPYT